MPNTASFMVPHLCSLLFNLPLLSPIFFCGLMLAITACAWMAHRLVRYHRRGLLQRLALQWQMNYAERDLFDLASRLSLALPLIGASELRVSDLIYASDSREYCCIFTAEYTRGVVVPQQREIRVMSFREAKDHDPGQAPALSAAPSHLSCLAQYKHLREIVWENPRK